eukprot:CAMPEP_0194062714 /NCGR_PEP_ID=MMETSP0009_2-20130614/78313_1 /TAXON_ID=210454 /ORGANISM="Grammatophora oceanica, Strain CCMP 410" /LENGTH=70 /DNA_ID=CAMNT_0038714557 /DNA_START=16 /DNA_END=224 /DNA_ORIENTATION=-
MSKRTPPSAEFTTNAHDQAEAAKLKARLASSASATASAASIQRLPSVSIDEGAHKYVLISAEEPSTSSNT